MFYICWRRFIAGNRQVRRVRLHKNCPSVHSPSREQRLGQKTPRETFRRESPSSFLSFSLFLYFSLPCCRILFPSRCFFIHQWFFRCRVVNEFRPRPASGNREIVRRENSNDFEEHGILLHSHLNCVEICSCTGALHSRIEN